MFAILQVENWTLYRVFYLLHLVAAVGAFGPLFAYPRIQRAGAGAAIASLHMRFVFPSLVLLWVLGMGMAGIGRHDLAESWWITGTILLWLVALSASWFLIRPSLTDSSESARAKLSAGIGVTHLVLVASLYLMIFKPGGYVINP